MPTTARRAMTGDGVSGAPATRHPHDAATVGERYHHYLAEHGYQSDPQQQKIVGHLQRLLDDLAAADGGVWRR